MAPPTPEDLARAALRKGLKPDDIARQLVAEGVSPIAAIKALRATTGLGLDELKPIIDRSLSPRQQEGNRRARDQMMDLASELADEFDDMTVTFEASEPVTAPSTPVVLEPYLHVELVTDRFSDDGAPRGSMGYIIEKWDDDAFEVEVMDADGATLAQFVATSEDIRPAG